MLTLKRKENEVVVIFTNEVEITIQLTEFTSKSAKLKIEATQEFKIYRQEILERDN